MISASQLVHLSMDIHRACNSAPPPDALHMQCRWLRVQDGLHAGSVEEASGAARTVQHLREACHLLHPLHRDACALNSSCAPTGGDDVVPMLGEALRYKSECVKRSHLLDRQEHRKPHCSHLCELQQTSLVRHRDQRPLWLSAIACMSSVSALPQGSSLLVIGILRAPVCT